MESYRLEQQRQSGAGYKITVTSPTTGEVFSLASPHSDERGEQRVMLLEGGFKGGFSTVKRTLKASVNQFGERVAGFQLPAFQGSFDVLLLDRPSSLVKTFHDWRETWSQFQDAVVEIVDTAGVSYWARVRADSFADVESDPHNRKVMRDSVSWTCLDGCYFGATQWFTGNRTIRVAGDVEPSAALVTTGAASTVRLPSGVTLNLPSTVGGRRISLDRGMAGHVTRVDGSTDRALWSSLRGALVGTVMQPHTDYAFQLGAGVTLEVTPRYLSWR